MDRVLGIIGFEEEHMDDDEKMRDNRFREEDDLVPASKRKGQVLNLHAQRQMKVVVSEPRVFEDVQGLAENLKSRRPVIVNLEKAEPELAKRVVDFISGATYALNGTLQKVGSGIFLVVPSNMDISSELGDQLKDRGLFSWMK
ncbi:MAG: cell division protein SepF [Peptococcaceae bacterium BRH_c4a]|nr:MAG: cell division protein SepF [Peptococcaceae bacterium BRH_c4a]